MSEPTETPVVTTVQARRRGPGRHRRGTSSEAYVAKPGERVCLLSGCRLRHMARGLCHIHYVSAKRSVERGETTWEALVADGKAAGATRPSAVAQAGKSKPRTVRAERANAPSALQLGELDAGLVILELLEALPEQARAKLIQHAAKRFGLVVPT